MIKYIFSDLDATLLDSNKKLSLANKKAIDKAKEKGIRFLVNSGRLPALMSMYGDALDLNSCVAGNGSLIKVDGKIIYSCPLDKKDSLSLYTYITENKIGPRVYTLDNFYIVEDYEKENASLKMFNYAKLDLKAFAKLIKNEDIYKICFYSKDKEELESIRNYVLENDNNMKAFYSNSCFLEIVNKKVSKGKGIKKFCELLNVKKEEVLTIGDNENDSSMLDSIYTSACPNNAIAKVKEVCDYISPKDCDHDAIKDIIEHFCDL